MNIQIDIADDVNQQIKASDSPLAQTLLVRCQYLDCERADVRFSIFLVHRYKRSSYRGREVRRFLSNGFVRSIRVTVHSVNCTAEVPVRPQSSLKQIVAGSRQIKQPSVKTWRHFSLTS